MEVKDEMRSIGNEKSASGIQSCLASASVRKKRTVTTVVTFLAQGVKLVEERWEMHDDARADDARYGRIDQSCAKELSITWP